MAITRAQQFRQMLKKGGEPVVQGGVENYPVSYTHLRAHET